MLRKKLLVALFATLLAVMVVPVQLTAQENPLNLEVRSAVYGSTQGALPFWLHSNRDGTVDSSGVNWINAVQADRLWIDQDNFSIKTGGTLIGRFSNTNSAHFSELYLHADLGGARLSIGRFIDPIGLNNHNLSAGSLIISRNATPMPKIRIATPDFIPIPYTDGELQFKGMFAHGWLGGDRFVENAFIHQKFLYLRLKPGAFSATGGLIHNVVWGGTHPEFGRLPSSFGDFLRVVAGRNAGNRENTPVNETRGVIGNSVAAYDFGLHYEFNQLSLSLNRMYYLEASAAPDPIFNTPWDGSWGININFKEKQHFVNGFTYEYINTKQSDGSGDNSRRDNYYNNGIYLSGWTYMNRVLGNPLFLFNREIPEVTNNVFLAHHIGFQGYLMQHLSYKVLGTYSRNYGAGITAGPGLEQISGFMTFSYTAPKWSYLSLTASLAIDTGDLYEDTLGFEIGFVLDR